MLLLGRCQRFFRLKRTQQIIKFPQLITWVIAHMSAKKNTQQKNNSEAYHMKQKHINVLHYHNILLPAKKTFFLDVTVFGDPHSQHRPWGIELEGIYTPSLLASLNDFNREVFEVAPENQLLYSKGPKKKRLDFWWKNPNKPIYKPIFFRGYNSIHLELVGTHFVHPRSVTAKDPEESLFRKEKVFLSHHLTGRAVLLVAGQMRFSMAVC